MPESRAALAAALILGVLAAWAASTSGLSPIDDHHLAAAFARGGDLGYYVSRELGRFVPLVGQEYGWVAKAVGPSPQAFFAVAAIKIVLAGLLLWRCLRLSGARAGLALALWCCVMLSLGFAATAFRLQVSEINQLVLALAFAWCCLALEGLQPGDRRRAGVAAAAVGTMLLAMLYKEATFVFALAYGGAEAARHHRLGRRVPAHAWALLALGAAYVAAYGLWRMGGGAGSYAGFHPLAHASLAYRYLATDPLIVLVVLPLAAARAVAIARDAGRHSIQDSFLAAAAGYALAYFALGLHSPYYLLPAYGFAACAVVGWAVGDVPVALRGAAMVLIVVITANTLPVAVSEMQAQHDIPGNHAAFVRGLAAWLKANPPPSGRRNVVFAGVSAASGVEVLSSARTFLEVEGVPPAAFRIRASQPVDNEAIAAFYRARPEAAELFEDPAGYTPQPGDVVVVGPHASAGVAPPPEASSAPLHASPSQFALPRWWAVHWAIHCAGAGFGCGERLRAALRPTGYRAYLLK